MRTRFLENGHRRTRPLQEPNLKRLFDFEDFQQ